MATATRRRLPLRGGSTGITTSVSVSIASTASASGTQADPRMGMPSSAVQIHNKVPCTLIVTAGGNDWSVTGLQTSTIPLHPDGTGLSWSMQNNSPATQAGEIAFVWLLTRQLVPQADGPLAVNT